MYIGEYGRFFRQKMEKYDKFRGNFKCKFFVNNGNFGGYREFYQVVVGEGFPLPFLFDGIVTPSVSLRSTAPSSEGAKGCLASDE